MKSKSPRLIWSVCLLLMSRMGAPAADADFSERLARAADREKATLLNEWAYSLRNENSLLCFEKATEALHQAEKTGEPVQLGWALALIGLSQCYRGELPSAEKNLLEAIGIFKQSGAGEKELQALSWLGFIHYQKGCYPRALELYGLVRDKAGDYGNIVLKADALTNIAIILRRQGEFRKAMGNYLDALDIYEALGISSKTCINLINIGVLYNQLQNPDKSLEYYREALKKARKFGSEKIEASALTNIGTSLANLGQNDLAEANYLEALAIRKKANATGKIVHLLISLAHTSRMSEKMNRAQDYLNEAGDLLDRDRLDYLRGAFLLEKGNLMLQKKDYDRAIAAAREVLTLQEKTEGVNEEIDAQLLLSEIYSELGDSTKALQHYRLYRDKAEKFIGNTAGSQVLELDFSRRREKMDRRIREMQQAKNRLLWGGIMVALILAVGLVLALLGRRSLKRRSQFLLGLKEDEIRKAKGSMQWMMGELKDYVALKNRRPYEKSTLRKEEADLIAAALTKRMADEQEYVNPDLTLAALAAMIHCSAKELSQVINERFGKNFNDFVNSYRIEFAQRKLVAKPGLSILEIAFEAGFNSKTSFNISFKKLTGLTPRQFRCRQVKKD
jgi:AraC-like DNA-binding protein/Tfp pilus assembly protein PilF